MATTNQELGLRRAPKASIQGQFGELEVLEVNISTWEAKFRTRGTEGPEFTTRLSMIQPSSDEDSDAFWKMLVDDAIRRLRADDKVPDFVKGYEVSTDEDSTGDPALYVKILVTPKAKYTNSEVGKWLDFTDLLQNILLGLRLQRYPYVNVGEIRRKR